jgi:hypothetical protein
MGTRLAHASANGYAPWQMIDDQDQILVRFGRVLRYLSRARFILSPTR